MKLLLDAGGSHLFAEDPGLAAKPLSIRDYLLGAQQHPRRP